MRKITLAIAILALACLHGAAQNITDSFYNRITHIFQNLEKNRVETGLLRDYGIDFIDIQSHNGSHLADSAAVSTYKWYELYKSLYTYRINQNAPVFPEPDTLAAAMYNYKINTGVTPLPLLLMKYNSFRADALTAGIPKLMVSNNILYDVYFKGNWQNPYTSEYVFAVGPGKNFYETSTIQFSFPQQFKFINLNNVQGIEVDFNDGSGWRVLNYNTTYTINYQDTGIKKIRYRATLTNNQQLITQSAIGVYFQAQNQKQPDQEESLVFPINATNDHSGCVLRIHYATGRSQIIAPLIIVEGFDSERPIEIDGLSDFDRFWQYRFNYGNLEGLIQDNMDIVYIDYNNGTDFIQRNAALLRDVINWVNARKAEAGSTQQNVILGFSMGGLVTRWCLRTMENNSQPHQTRLFISYDAPHQGAFVPLALQALNTHVANVPLIRLGSPAPGVLPGIINLNAGDLVRDLRVYSTPAARQQLLYYLQIAGQNGNGAISLNNTEHQNFITGLRALGYPQTCRNVALSHASECANLNGLIPGTEIIRFEGNYNTGFLSELLITPWYDLNRLLVRSTGYLQFQLMLLPGRNSIQCKFNLKAMPETGTSQLYFGRIWLQKTILQLIPVNAGITLNSYTPPTGLAAFESYPGGQTDFNMQTRDLRQAFTNNPSPGPGFFQLALTRLRNMLYNRGVTDFYVAEPGSFGFIPVTSALDVGRGNVTLNKPDYISRYVGTNPPAAPKDIPFANFLTTRIEDNVNTDRNEANTNSEHILHNLELRQGNWIAAEINNLNPRYNCTSFCGGDAISGTNHICPGQPEIFSIPGLQNSGFAIWSATPAGLVTITPLTLNGSSVSVSTNSNGGQATIRAIITDNSNNRCGTNTITQTVSLGSPAAYAYYNSPYGSNDLVLASSGGNTLFNPACVNNLITVTPYVPAGAWITWNVTPNGFGITWSPVGNNLTFTFIQPGQTLTATATVQSNCGSQTVTYLFNAVNGTGNCGSGGGGQQFRISSSPNPASNQMNVRVDVQAMQQMGINNPAWLQIKNIKLFSNMGVLRKELNYADRTQNVNINTGDLTNGLYRLQVTNGTHTVNRMIMIQR